MQYDARNDRLLFSFMCVEQPHAKDYILAHVEAPDRDSAPHEELSFECKPPLQRSRSIDREDKRGLFGTFIKWVTDHDVIRERFQAPELTGGPETRAADYVVPRSQRRRDR